MRVFRDQPIRRKLTLLLVFVVGVVLIMSSGALIAVSVQTTKASMVREFSMLANVLAASSAAALSIEPGAAASILEDLRGEPTIVYACIYDRSGKPVGEHRADGSGPFPPPEPRPDSHEFTGEGHLHLFRSVRLGDEFVGTIFLRAHAQEIGLRIQRAVLVTAVVFLLGMAVAVALAFWVQRIVSDPIMQLADAARTISQEQDYAVRVVKRSNDEVGVLCDSFNAMVERLEQHTNHLEQLVREKTEGLARKTEELAQSNREIQRYAHELARSNAELEQFAYVASHDLKAPLRAIDNLAQWICEDASAALPEKSRQHLQKLQQRVQRMERLMDDLLQYSRAGRVKGQIQQVDTGRLLEEVGEMLAPPASFSIRVAPSMPTVTSDKAPLKQVFMNLIGNAIKHHDRPDGRVEVCAENDENDEFVAFTVADDGPGIPREFHERIFRMFQTLRPRDQVEGSGIGLAVVKKLVESQGGTITVDSEVGRGTRFRFTWRKTASEEMQP